MPDPRLHVADDTTVARAERALRRVEPRLRALIDRHGPYPVRPRGRKETHFEALARAIVFQQLAGRAAAAIHERVRTAVGRPFTAQAVLGVSDEALRAAGLSGAKMASLRDLAAATLDGRLTLARMGRLPDDEVIEALTTVRGIGRWTAEMFLIFRLGRLDVWPAGDLGVRKGVAVLRGLAEPPSPTDMPAVGEAFAPYRSVAAWYCWRALDTLTPA